jgi:hypothetical protein
MLRPGYSLRIAGRFNQLHTIDVFANVTHKVDTIVLHPTSPMLTKARASTLSAASARVVG